MFEMGEYHIEFAIIRDFCILLFFLPTKKNKVLKRKF